MGYSSGIAARAEQSREALDPIAAQNKQLRSRTHLPGKIVVDNVANPFEVKSEGRGSVSAPFKSRTARHQLLN